MAVDDTLLALRMLGVELNARPSVRDGEKLFETVKNEVLAVGFDSILAIPRATGPRADLVATLLIDAGERV